MTAYLGATALVASLAFHRLVTFPVGLNSTFQPVTEADPLLVTTTFTSAPVPQSLTIKSFAERLPVTGTVGAVGTTVVTGVTGVVVVIGYGAGVVQVQFVPQPPGMTAFFGTGPALG